MDQCRLCSGKVDQIFTASILRCHKVPFVCCSRCSLLQAANPFWLEEAYKDSINISDTGILARNLSARDKTSIILWLMYGLRKLRESRFLDFGGGYGIFVRLMRDLGLDFYWFDSYSENLVARGFEDKWSKYDAIVAFEVLEHLLNPFEILENIFSRTRTLIFSTELYPYRPPKPEAWTYYGFSHGQHINFFNLNTLKFIAYQFNLNLSTDGKNFHVLSMDHIPSGLMKKVRVIRRVGGLSLLQILLNSKIMHDHDLIIFHR